MWCQCAQFQWYSPGGAIVPSYQRHCDECAKMAEPIDLPFGLWTQVGRKKHKFNRIHQVAQKCPHGRAHWHHLANMIETSVFGGDAVLCQTTLITCLVFCYLCNISTYHFPFKKMEIILLNLCVIFGRPFLKRFALCHVCLSICPVCKAMAPCLSLIHI